MPVSQGYRDFVLDQLDSIGVITYRKMFGAIGIYCDQIFFAIISSDVLYFKVDDSNRDDYERIGMGPFKPYKDKPEVMQYYEVPIDVLENRDELKLWAEKAITVARNKGKKAK
jgi:DNA transformation protein